MRNSILSAALIASAILGGIAGGAIRDREIQQDQIDAWHDVLVLNGGTVVANPSAMSPRELASATIIDPMDHITICTDRSGETFVNPKADECQNFKELHSL